jgi:hypothetical protein
MAQAISSLYIELAAETAKLRKDLDKATRLIDRSTKSWNKSIGTVKTALSAMAAALSARELYAHVRATTDWAAELVNTANLVGQTTDRIQALRIEAGKFGVSAENVDDALKEFALRISEARTGTGTLKDVFEELRIDLKDGNGEFKDTNELLKKYAEALRGIKDPAEIVRASEESMGGESAKFGQALANSTMDIDDNVDALKELGQIIENETLERTAELNSEWSEMTKSMETKFKKMTLSVVGAATDMWDSLQRTFNFAGFIGAMTEIKSVESEIERINKLVFDMESKYDLQQQTGGVGSGEFGGTTPAEYASNMAAYRKQLLILDERLETLKSLQAPPGAGGGGAGGGGAGGGGTDPVKVRAMATDDYTQSLIDNENAAWVLLQSLKDQQSQLIQSHDSWRAFSAEQIAYADGVSPVLTGLILEQVEALDRLENELAATAKREAEILENERELERVAFRFADIFGDVFSRAIVNGDQFGDVLKSLERDLLNLITQLLVIKPLTNFIGTTLQGSGTFGALAELFTPAALGGPVWGGQPLLVGEKGPELFVPSTSGQIVPNNQINININQSGGGDFRSSQQLASMVGDRVNRAVTRNR